MNAVPVTAGGTGATSASGAMANLLPGVASDGNNGIKVTGNVAAGESIPATSPYVDIRAHGAVLDNATPIDSALQAAINSYQYQQGHSATILLPCAGSNGSSTSGNGCYLDNPSLLTMPSGYGAAYKFIIQGNLRVGSTLVAPSWENWYSESGGFGNQFQTGDVPASIEGPTVNGTLGTAVTTPGTAVTIAPTFTNGNIAHLPAGSAITIAGVVSSTATAVRTTAGNGYGQTVLTLASAIRIPPGELVTITGCSDSSVNAANIVVSASDYSAQTLTYYQTDAAATTATGCTVKGFNDDAFESARIFCSNGTNMPGYSYTCGAGQITIVTNHAHSTSDQWGEVAAGPAFNTYTPQTWEGINIYNCFGACFWGEGSTNLVMNHVGAQAGPVITSVAVEQSATYLSQVHDSNFSATGVGQSVPNCPSGGCTQPSYPYALRCDSDVPGLYYASGNTGCNAMDIDQGTVLVGGIKIDGNGSNPITGLPRITSIMYEEVWGNGVTVDNRFGIEATSCLVLKDQYLQDNTSGMKQYLVGYTDSKVAGGCVEIDNDNSIDTGALTNAYFNGRLSVNGISNFQNLPSPVNASGPLGIFNEGGMLKGEIEGEGSGFGPFMLPFGSLPITTSPATWASTCATWQDCTVATVVGPDGPSGQMQAAELDALTTTGGGIPIGTWTGATYPGDHFIYGAWVRPGKNESITTGYYGGANDSFSLGTQGTDLFSPTPANNGTLGVSTPAAFGTALNNNGWYPQVAIATITSGEAASHTITFNLNAGPQVSGSNPITGNQFAQPFWTFIPGPNNPAYAGVTTDQIEEARQDQYHGCVPPNVAAGQAATCESLNAPKLIIPGAPSGSYAKADGSGYGTPGGAGTVNNGSAYGVAYYPAAGTAVSGATPFAGIGYFSTSAAPVAATSTQIAAAIGSGVYDASGAAAAAQTNAEAYTAAGGIAQASANTVNGMPTGCVQYPCVLVSSGPTTYSGTSSQPASALTIYTPTTAGLYRMCTALTVEAVASSATGAEIVTYETMNGVQLALGSTVTATSLNSSGEPCYLLQPDVNSGIKVWLYLNNVTGSPTFLFSYTLERLK